MAVHSVVSKYYSGQGIVMLATRDINGDAEGFLPIGNVSELKVSTSIATLDHKTTEHGTSGIDKKLQTETAVNISMVFESIDADNLKLGLQGDLTIVPAGSGIVGPNTTSVALGRSYDIGALKVSNVVVKNSAENITYEEGKNYTINANSGSIYYMTAAEQVLASPITTLVDASEVHITSYDTAGYKEIHALTQDLATRWLRFEGLNTVDTEEPVIVDVYKFSIGSIAELSLISDDIAGLPMEGSVLLDPTKLTGSKYYRVRSTT
ncbi:MAG: hypothetical protein GQ570_03885 [Helicobacteraceae bacterium]|nr:hypothetical protein [Helicobacteraceae bacterium]